jgi:hypothetical protein
MRPEKLDRLRWNPDSTHRVAPSTEGMTVAKIHLTRTFVAGPASLPGVRSAAVGRTQEETRPSVSLWVRFRRWVAR